MAMVPEAGRRRGKEFTLRRLVKDCQRVKGEPERQDIGPVPSRIRSIAAALTPIVPASFFLLPQVFGAADAKLEFLVFFLALLLAFSTGSVGLKLVSRTRPSVADSVSDALHRSSGQLAAVLCAVGSLLSDLSVLALLAKGLSGSLESLSKNQIYVWANFGIPASTVDIPAAIVVVAVFLILQITSLDFRALKVAGDVLAVISLATIIFGTAAGQTLTTAEAIRKTSKVGLVLALGVLWGVLVRPLTPRKPGHIGEHQPQKLRRVASTIAAVVGFLIVSLLAVSQVHNAHTEAFFNDTYLNGTYHDSTSVFPGLAGDSKAREWNTWVLVTFLFLLFMAIVTFPEAFLVPVATLTRLSEDHLFPRFLKVENPYSGSNVTAGGVCAIVAASLALGSSLRKLTIFFATGTAWEYAVVILSVMSKRLMQMHGRSEEQDSERGARSKRKRASRAFESFRRRLGRVIPRKRNRSRSGRRGKKKEWVGLSLHHCLALIVSGSFTSAVTFLSNDATWAWGLSLTILLLTLGTSLLFLYANAPKREASETSSSFSLSPFPFTHGITVAVVCFVFTVALRQSLPVFLAFFVVGNLLYVITRYWVLKEKPRASEV
ncbi:unnamed protein product [Darwinula stevensoni]|uniref:Uncharacterized protein n=1 Tax=Darwinula stevensoni TaxID=69355 RepID=A0A7R9A8Q4_9CRUS|nr:unnamed protein product [Darwinula stevensoni]CAG0896527.1 unnamed protein product [Darwinula stevensoni]